MKASLTAASLLLLAFASACDGGKETQSGPASRKGPGGGMKFPVEVREVESVRVEYVIGAVGSVEAFEKIQVTARVAGVIDRVRFTEGDVVKAGQVLVEIEPERFRLALAAADAQLARAEAARAEAEAGFKRREAAVAENPGLIPGEELDTWRTRALSAAAEVSGAKAAAGKAALDLRDAFVKATIAGTIETRTAQTGQYVQPGAVLASLVRRDPLLLRFTVTEQDAARLKTGMTASFVSREKGRTFSSRITFVAQAADEATRMVNVTAQVADEDREALRPGTFAEVSVGVGDAAEAPVIPQTAIRASERGFLAFVIVDDAARERILTLGMRTADGRVEVKQGLAVGELLVVRGAEALKDGAGVRVTNPSAPTSDAGTPREKPL